MELRRYGIKTVVIQPGAFKTEFFGRLVKDFQLNEAEEGEELLDPAMVSEVRADFEQKNEVLAKLALSFPPGDPVAEAMELRFAFIVSCVCRVRVVCVSCRVWWSLVSG